MVGNSKGELVDFGGAGTGDKLGAGVEGGKVSPPVGAPVGGGVVQLNE